MADTFDLLLYKSSPTASGLVRLYSKSEWDHAAMVIKFGSQPKEVFILESTGDMGVSIKNFAEIIPHIGDFYTKVALRHIKWERPDSSLGILENFL